MHTHALTRDTVAYITSPTLGVMPRPQAARGFTELRTHNSVAKRHAGARHRRWSACPSHGHESAHWHARTGAAAAATDVTAKCAGVPCQWPEPRSAVRPALETEAATVPVPVTQGLRAGKAWARTRGAAPGPAQAALSRHSTQATSV
jgi:hypothetical protein